MRSLIIAQYLVSKCPSLDIQFILNRNAPYSTSCPFDALLLSESPTKEGPAVAQFILNHKPDVVIFDAAGRAGHFRLAKQQGATVFFLSQHAKKRARGMRLNRALHLDYHFVVQPDFALKKISWLHALKLKAFGLAAPVNVGPVFTPPSKARLQILLDEYSLQDAGYILFSAGSGGHKICGTYATNMFYTAALEVSACKGMQAVVIAGSNFPEELKATENVTVIRSLDNLDFISLLSASRLAVLSGGGSLLQAMALEKPVVTTAVAKDQAKRIEACLNAGHVVSVLPDLQDLVTACIKMLNSEDIKSDRGTRIQNGLFPIAQAVLNAVNLPLLKNIKE